MMTHFFMLLHNFYTISTYVTGENDENVHKQKIYASTNSTKYSGYAEKPYPFEKS